MSVSERVDFTVLAVASKFEFFFLPFQAQKCTWISGALRVKKVEVGILIRFATIAMILEVQNYSPRPLDRMFTPHDS